MTIWDQQTIRLPGCSRGFHLVTRELESQLKRLPEIQIGIAHLFMMHTSASLTLNENADPTVRGDFERHFNAVVPEDAPYLRHTFEGSDDMPAHLKSSILGAFLNVPIRDGEFLLGTWQGIYLCEHRDRSSGRTITVTIHGESTATT